MVLIMQRLAEDDPTAYLLENGRKNIKHICLPAEVTDDIRPLELREKYVDGLLDPVRMTKKYLKDFEAQNGSYTYAGQFLQTPTPPDGGMFNTGEFEIVDFIDPADIQEVWRAWDKAGTDANRKKNPDACYTAGCKMAKLKDGRFAVLDMVRGRWNADVRERKIKKTAIRDGRKTRIVIEQEPGSGGKESAQNTIRNLAGFSIVKERPTGDKIFRADPYSVQVNEGNVVLVRGAWNKEYINELKHFPMSRFKDQVDASSMAFAKLNRPVAPRIRTL
jgi:predicted phage terminase large subunit-like protein